MSPMEIIFAEVGVFLTAISIIVAILSALIQLFTGMYPLSFIEEKKKQKLLQEKFSRGPYDKGTIERSTKYYIWPKCSNLDPAQEQEIRHALMATRESLLEKVNQFLDSGKYDTQRHLLILADSGMGKTSFVLNYYFYNSKRPKNKQHQLVIVPLGIKDPDAQINKIPDQEEKVIFLDAFDEDVEAIKGHRERLFDLMEQCKRFKKVIITCRTQFFPKAEEIPVETGIIKFGPRKAGDKGIYEFWKLYLSPFDDDDVRIYLKKKYPLWRYSQRKKALEIAVKIPNLSVRPMLLAYIPDILDSKKNIRLAYQLYEAMVEAWLERESRWVDKNALHKFSEKLALNIYLNREERGVEGVPYSELSILAESWNIKLKPWQLGGRSLLNRDANNNYKFSHRSIMEYFVATKIFRGNDELNIALTDQIKSFLVEMMARQRIFLRSAFNMFSPEAKFFIKYKEDGTKLESTDVKEIVVNIVGETQFDLPDLARQIDKSALFNEFLTKSKKEFGVKEFGMKGIERIEDQVEQEINKVKEKFTDNEVKLAEFYLNCMRLVTSSERNAFLLFEGETPDDIVHMDDIQIRLIPRDLDMKNVEFIILKNEGNKIVDANDKLILYY